MSNEEKEKIEREFDRRFNYILSRKRERAEPKEFNLNDFIEAAARAGEVIAREESRNDSGDRTMSDWDGAQPPSR